MTVGTAIFFGSLMSLMIAMAVLYAVTKDRWNWKKVIKRAILIPVAVLLIIGALIWIYSEIQDRPIKQREFQGIKLGDSKENVLFKKGATPKGIDALPDGFYPDFIIETKPSKHGPWENYQDRTNIIKNKDREKQVKIFGDIVAFPAEMPDKEIGEIIRNYIDRNRNVLSYSDLDIVLKNDKAVIIRKTCSDDDYYTGLNRAECKDSYQELENKLGKAKFIKCSKDSLTRLYSFPQYQSAYVVNKDGIKQLIIYEPAYEEELTSHNKSFGECKM